MNRSRRVGGQDYPLPKALTADNINRIIEVPVPLAGLGANTELVFRDRDGAGGYRVAMASILVEQHPPPRPKKRLPLPPVQASPWQLRLLMVALGSLAVLALLRLGRAPRR